MIRSLLRVACLGAVVLVGGPSQQGCQNADCLQTGVEQTLPSGLSRCRHVCCDGSIPCRTRVRCSDTFGCDTLEYCLPVSGVTAEHLPGTILAP